MTGISTTSRAQPQRPRRDRGQALVEFALVTPFLVLFLAGAIDFGMGYSARLEIANAARVGARWASLHSGDVNSGWSASATPADNTIQGQIIYSGDTRQIVNDNNHMAIKYYIWTEGTTSSTYCGSYDQPTNAFVGAPLGGGGNYTALQCVAVGNIVQVTVNYDYPVLTPIFSAFYGPTVSIGSKASFVIQS